MIFMARFLMGFFAAFIQVLMSGYLGESADMFEAKTLMMEPKNEVVEQTIVNKCGSHAKENHKKDNNLTRKRTQKDFLFILYGFSKALFTPFIFGEFN